MKQIFLTVNAPSQKRLVTEMVSSQAGVRPEAIAVASATRLLRYAELEERANALADLLRTQGVGPEVAVGLCTTRSVEMVVGALGILKAGGAYLPLDPAYPAARLAFILEDGQVPVVVAGEAVKDRVPAGNHRMVMLDDCGWLVESAALPRSAPPKMIAPRAENLAYVIYTSGSTGRPKGVEVTHDNLTNLVQWHAQTFQVTAADRASQIARLGFDAAVWEIWPYLAAGASLHLPDEETISSPESLRDWLVAQRITIGFAPTPLAEYLLALSWPEEAALRALLVGGDTLHRYPPLGLPFLLVNNYGPTECTVVATSGTVSPSDSKEKLPPIGRAITNTETYILDASGQEVPAGTAGMLHIGGKGVARGYRNRPDQTAERFIPNPFASKAGERLFKTGDLVKALPNGEIAFLGRADEQLKVRGFRVEPNEVAAALNEHPHVFQSAVTGHQADGAGTRLIGYFVGTPEYQPRVSELRNFLEARLPDFMVPAFFVRLEQFPRTPNGKIDRRSLPVPDESNTLRDNGATAPLTDVEIRVAKILKGLLELDHIEMEDNFFSLGGHSLLGAQLVARVRDTFAVEMPLRAVFEAPSLADLSFEIQRLLQAKKGAQPRFVSSAALDPTP